MQCLTNRNYDFTVQLQLINGANYGSLFWLTEN